MGFGTLITIFLFELTNIYTIKKIIKHQGILHYIKAWNHTILNSTLLGPFVYKQITIHLHNKNNSIIYNFINIQKILFIHSIGYWFVHKLMHTKTLWCIHKYHHSYSIYVTPVVCMAVTPMEYTLAYMLPFIIGSYLINPSSLELFYSASIVSFCNIIIHCPSIKNLSKYYPNWWISPNKHLLHHSSKNKHIAASTYDIDYILQK